MAACFLFILSHLFFAKIMVLSKKSEYFFKDFIHLDIRYFQKALSVLENI